MKTLLAGFFILLSSIPARAAGLKLIPIAKNLQYPVGFEVPNGQSVRSDVLEQEGSIRVIRH